MSCEQCSGSGIQVLEQYFGEKTFYGFLDGKDLKPNDIIYDGKFYLYNLKNLVREFIRDTGDKVEGERLWESLKRKENNFEDLCEIGLKYSKYFDTELSKRKILTSPCKCSKGQSMSGLFYNKN